MNDALPLVTIVTPSYNQGEFIAATIESVLSQDYPNIEYIVVDGSSDDNTAEVVAQYAGRLTFISEKDRGQADAINKGLRMARGSIVSYLNSDDLFLPGAVSAAVTALLEHPDWGAVYGEGYQIDERGEVKSRFVVTEAFNLWKLVNVSDYILQQTFFWRSSVHDAIGLLDEDLHYGLDWEFFMRIGKQFMMGYIPEFMGSIREHGAAKTAAGGIKRFRELARILRRHSPSRFPPAYFIYGLDTYEKFFCERIPKIFGWFPRLSNKLQRVVTRISHTLIGRFALDSQGWYGDRWAGKRLYYMLPPSQGRYIELTVMLPEVPFGRQQIAVRGHGQLFARESFGAGIYTLSIPVPRALWDTTLSFTIDAAKWLVPDPEGDRRQLCYLLERVAFSERFMS